MGSYSTKQQARLYGIDPVKVRIEMQRAHKESGMAKYDEMESIMEEIQKAIRRCHVLLPEERTCASKLVDCEEDLVSCIQDGWDVVKELSNGRILLRKDVSSNMLDAPHRPY